MFTQLIWWSAIVLEAVLLLRGLQEKLVTRFPVFFWYVLFVLLDELLRFCTYRWYPDIYAPIYWTTQFLGLVIGSLVVFEIYRVGLRDFPGTAKMARNLLLLVFAAVFTKALISSMDDPLGWLAGTPVELERNLRIVQACAIIALVGLFRLYWIPFGRNLRGILLGYGFFIALSVIQLTLATDFADKIKHVWSYVQPSSYLCVLCIWTTNLWSSQSSPETIPAIQLEHDYKALIAATNRRFQEARASLGRAVRP